VLEKNMVLSEIAQGERSIRQGEHFLFDPNKLMNLPAGWSVLFGQGVAQACYVSAYRVTKSILAVTPTAAPMPAEAEVISDVVEPVPSTRIRVGSKKRGGGGNGGSSGGGGVADDDFFSLE
jgi:uncharacterized membrane protein YgcG